MLEKKNMEMKYSDLIQKIEKTKLKELVSLGLGCDEKNYNEIKRSIPKTLKIAGFKSINKIGFKSYKRLVTPILNNKIYEFDKTAKLLFKGYFLKKNKEISIVKTALENQGYKIIQPDFIKEVLIMESLKREDVYEDNKVSFFRPNGKNIEEIDEEDASIIAALLGWFVNEDIKDESDTTTEQIENIDIQEEKQEIEEVSVVKDVELGSSINFEESIVSMQSDFIKTAEVFIKFSEDLKNGELPINWKENNDIDILKRKLDTLKKEFSIPNDIYSIKEIQTEYKNILEAENQELYDQVLGIINIYRRIYHTKGQDLPFKEELDRLANKYEDVVLENIVNKNDEWYIKLINGQHLYNYLIRAIELSLTDSLDEDELDNLLDKLEIECKEYNFDFFKKLSRQINRGNLAFKEGEVPIVSEIKSKKATITISKNEVTIAEEEVVTEEIITEKKDTIVDDEISINLEEEEEEVAAEVVEKEVEIIKETTKSIEEVFVSNIKEEEVNDLGVVEIEGSEKEIKVVEVVKKSIKKKPQKIQEKEFSVEEENILNLLEKEEPELAYHLALCYEKEGKELFLPSWLLQNLFLSLNIRSAEAPIAQKVISNLDKYSFNFNKSDKGYFINQLVFSSILRPSLFAYSYGTSGVLDGIASGKNNEFSEIKKLIADFMLESGGILNFDRLIQLSSEVELKEHRINFKQKIKEWLFQAQTFKYKNKPKHKFSIALNNWVTENGWINSLITNFLDTDDISFIRSLLNDLQEGNWKSLFEKELNDIVKKNGYKDGNDEFDTWYENRIDDLKELLNEGLGYYSNIDLNKGNYQINKKDLEIFVNKLTNEINKIKQLLGDISNNSILNKISLTFLNKAFNNVTNVLNGKEIIENPLKLSQILNKDLLKLDFYESDFDWTSKAQVPSLIDSILNYAKNSEQSIEIIAKKHIEAGNFESYNRLKSIYDFDENILDSGQSETEFSERIKFEIRKLKTEVERGSAYGYILNGKRSMFISSIEEIVENNKSMVEGLNFPLLHFHLNNINSKILQEKKALKDEYSQLITPEIENKEVLLNYLRKDNFLVFNETLAGIKGGIKIENEESDEILMDFFQNFLKKVSPQKSSAICTAISKRKSHLGFDYSELTSLQAKESTDIYRKWKSLKSGSALKKDTSKGNLEMLLESIGFKATNLEEPIIEGKSVYANFKCETVKGRNRTPIPRFGSIAQGNYRLICLKENSNEEDLLELIKYFSPTESNRATIVFYFGWLDQKNRLEILKLSKKRKMSFLLLDEALLLYLCGLNKSKFPAFIQLATPITFAEPYQTASSNLPEEMFYGRASQKEKLKNINGDYSCLIYGGRQLGKTVLLREVERVFHDPEKNNYAIYIDLRDNGIGLWNPIEKITNVLFENLRTIPDLFPDKIKYNTGLPFLLNKLKEWFDKNENARIILFLDESDSFLEKESESNWPHILPLKGLMEKTDKKFKIVLAGLHDVRRTIKIPNNPLAHFGSPLCVGSMLESEEALEAQKLVKIPLETLGFKFESEDLVLMILSHCNWYPSLIQIFCSTLLNILNNKRVIKELPILIREKDVSQAYINSGRQIKEKFKLTLNLDERYDLLANIIANEILEDQTIHTKGLSVNEVKDLAIFYWSAGFESSNPKMKVNDLLEEMTDLGVLRIESTGNFTLRNPNLIGFIGTEKQITDNLYKTRTLPLEFNREVSRINYKKENRDLRSPFPAIYYDKIITPENKILVFRGSKMGGIDYIQEFLLSKKDEVHLIIPEETSFKGSEQEKLWEFIEKKRKQKKENIILFTSEMEFTYEDILFVNKKIDKKTSLSAVFIMNPVKIWNFSLNVDKVFAKLENLNIQIINIPQWSKEVAKEWFKEVCTNADISDIFNEVGNWHYLLDRCHAEINLAPEEWKEKLTKISELELKDNPNFKNDFGLLDDKMIKILKDLIIWDGDMSKKDFIIEYGENIYNYFLSINIIDNENNVNSIVKKLIENE
jgi:hypothetical protein